MKKPLRLTLCVSGLLASTQLFAQVPGANLITKQLPKMELGIKLGADIIDLKILQNHPSRIITGGLYGSVRKGKLGCRAEILASSATYKFDPKGDFDTRTMFVKVPLLAEFSPAKRVHLQLGPQLNIPIATEPTDNAYAYFPKFKASVSVVLGAEVALPMGFRAGARYIYGITDAYSIHYYDALGNDILQKGEKTNSMQVYVGYRLFRFGK